MSRIIIDLMAEGGTEATAEDLNITDDEHLTADEVLAALKEWGDFWQVASDFGLMDKATIYVRVLHKRPKGRTDRTYAEWSVE